MAARLVRRISVLALLTIVLSTIPGTANAQQTLTLELNRLDTERGGCRIFFLVKNPSDRDFSKLDLDIAFFDKKEIIIGRTNIEFGRIRKQKTTLHSVSFADFDCAKVGKVLLNDVVACGAQTTGGKKQDCLDLVTLSYRGKVEFFK